VGRGETILAKITAIRQKMRRAREKLPETVAEFEGDLDLRDIVIHNLWQALQAAIDLASHVVSEEGYGQPDSFGSVFDLLVQNGVLADELGARMRRAVGLRNLIVHEYARLDLSLVHRVVAEDLADVERFLHALAAHVGLLP
jgi:uncharacterized protein YutE (UPF0331/DUF86 family)